MQSAAPTQGFVCAGLGAPRIALLKEQILFDGTPMTRLELARALDAERTIEANLHNRPEHDLAIDMAEDVSPEQLGRVVLTVSELGYAQLTFARLRSLAKAKNRVK